MKLWTSGEIQVDVADKYRQARRVIEEAVNRELTGVILECQFDEWAYIGIIRSVDHPDYQEVVRRDSRRNVLEFRLKINHQEFLMGTDFCRKELILDSLLRATHLMADLGVSENDRQQLEHVLQKAKDSIQ